MISLALIPKIIFQPRKAFEELKDSTTASEGILMLIIVFVLSLLLYGIVARITGLNIMAFSFGFGPLFKLNNAIFFFSLNLLGILVISYASNFIAAKFSGTGDLRENFAFICYSKALCILPAIASAIVLLWFRLQINLALAGLNAGTAGGVGYISALSYVFPVTGFFLIWQIFIMTEAVSISHNISRAKSLASIIASYLIVGTIQVSALTLIGKSVLGT